jgi:hypothetical protein
MALGSCPIVELTASFCYDRSSEILILVRLAHEALHFLVRRWRCSFQSLLASRMRITPGVECDYFHDNTCIVTAVEKSVSRHSRTGVQKRRGRDACGRTSQLDINRYLATALESAADSA